MGKSSLKRQNTLRQPVDKGKLALNLSRLRETGFLRHRGAGREPPAEAAQGALPGQGQAPARPVAFLECHQLGFQRLPASFSFLSFRSLSPAR